MGTFGIDLGTTYSCIARLDDHGNAEIIQNQAEQSDTLASAVYFESADNVIVGSAAKDMVETDGARVVEFVKREIGKPDARTYEFDGKTYTPVEISSLILTRLKDMAVEQGETVENVVITCPAYFGYEERNATKLAGELAGFNVLDIINEPTAAALSYCARQFQEERTIMVYDLGGGTFDVTVIKMSLETNADGQEVQKIRVLASGGNDRLGGKDWDDLLYSHIESVCCEENGLTPDDLEPETKQKIRSEVEKVKKKLTPAEKAKAKITVNGAITNVTVTREEFEQMTKDKVDQTIGYVNDVMAKLGNVKLDLILLVGGSTFMPMIRKAVEARFPDTPVNLHEPNLAVAKGAAIYANMLVDDQEETTEGSGGGETGGTDGTGETGETPEAPKVTKPATVIADQLPRSFGPGVLNMNDEYIIDNLVKQGDTSPASQTREYYTARENMKIIRLKVFESLSLEDSVVPCEDSAGNPLPADPKYAVKCLGKLDMELPPNTPAGAPIEVSFTADMTGIHIHTLAKDSGVEAEAFIEFKSNLDKEEATEKIQGMRVDGE